MTGPRVAVFGAGLIGQWLGGLLAPHAPVVLIGRAGRLAALDAGLRLTDADGLDRSVPAARLERSDDPAALAGADIVLATVKALDTEQAGRAIAAHAPPGALVVSLQNGVDNAARLAAAAPGRRVLAGMVPYNVAERAAAHLHRGTPGRVAVAADPALEALGRLFEAAGHPLDMRTDMEGVLWGKLLVNLNNAVNALSGLSLADELRQRGYRRAWALALDEALALVRRAAIQPVDPLPMPLALMPQILRLPDRLYRFVVASAGRTRVDPHARSSMADDLARGRRTEVEHLNGAVVRLAERLGRSAPVNARMVELVQRAEAGAPSLTAGPLLAALRRR